MCDALGDLVSRLKSYEPLGPNKRPQALDFVLDYTRFVGALESIHRMVGLEQVKVQVTRQVQSFISSYRRFGKPMYNQRLHTLLYGPPGCGKTQLGQYLAALWTFAGCLKPHPASGPIATILSRAHNTDNTVAKLNKLRRLVVARDPKRRREVVELFKSLKAGHVVHADPVLFLPPRVPKFIRVTRADLVDKYQGHTTDKVRRLLSEYTGGVIMIDEAYTLCTSGRDDFGKEALAEIINYMTTYPDNIAFIFAGYRREMEDTVLKLQPGLARRFSWTFEIKPYTPKDLGLIFMQQLKEKLAMDIPPDTAKAIERFFATHADSFPHYGGDTDTFCDFVRETFNVQHWDKALDDSLPILEYAKLYGDITMDCILEAYQKYLKTSIKASQAEDLSAIQHIYG